MKIIVMSLALLLLLAGDREGCAAQTPTPLPTASCLHHGDINFDGNLSFGDAQLTFLCALGLCVPSTDELCAGDCNGDGTITAGDA